MNQKTIYALGFFDGVHLGHQALLAECCRLAELHGCQAGAVTFTAHPEGLVLGRSPVLLNTVADRRRLLHTYGAATVKEIPFDRELMTTHWADFLNRLISEGAAGFVCGWDFRFGAGAKGTAEKLESFCKERQLPYAIVPEQTMDGERISSTRIRGLLEQGDMENVCRLLGHPYVFTGQVLSGKQLGRALGFPTANLAVPVQLTALKFGVYIGSAVVDGETYIALINVGVRPTVNGEGVIAEAYLIDFDGDLYGKEITLEISHFLRPEKKFDSLEGLKAQIAADIAQVRNLL